MSILRTAFSKHVNFSIETKKETLEFEARYTMHTYTDNRYGEDADGNRGLERTFIDDVELESVYSFNLDKQLTPTDGAIYRLGRMAARQRAETLELE